MLPLNFERKLSYTTMRHHLHPVAYLVIHFIHFNQLFVIVATVFSTKTQLTGV